MREYLTVTPDDDGKRVDIFLAEHFSVTRTASARLLDEGAALVNDAPAAKNRKLKSGESVSLELPPVKETETLPENIPLSIVYEDDDILDAYKEKRAKALYSEDERQVLRQSHKNTQVQKLYDAYLGKPNSHKAHELLHTTYQARIGFND